MLVAARVIHSPPFTGIRRQEAFEWASLVAQLVKICLPAMQETLV